MAGIQARIDLAHRWLLNAQASTEDAAGWGWVPDVPPNPQNTAEVVCALAEAQLPIPHREAVERLVRTQMVRSVRGNWLFRDAIDLSWRIRALRVLGVPDGDADIAISMEALLAAQQGQGGWSLSGNDGPLSVTATCSTVLALLDSRRDEVVASVRKGIFCLASVMDQARPPHEAFAAAQIACVASRPTIRELGGKRIEIAQSIACNEVMAYLARRRYEVEEEDFRRRVL